MIIYVMRVSSNIDILINVKYVSLDDESHFFFSRKIMKDIFELP
jgi:hypothetical protein